MHPISGQTSETSTEIVADGVGFEPTEVARPHRYSKPAHSTALPTVRILSGATGGIRTPDALAFNQALYQLSYRCENRFRLEKKVSGALGGESNARPIAYKAIALPTELRGQIHLGCALTRPSVRSLHTNSSCGTPQERWAHSRNLPAGKFRLCVNTPEMERATGFEPVTSALATPRSTS